MNELVGWCTADEIQTTMMRLERFSCLNEDCDLVTLSPSSSDSTASLQALSLSSIDTHSQYSSPSIMVLTDRQREDLHAGIYAYLMSRDGDAFRSCADALQAADPSAAATKATATNVGKTPLLEKKWTAIPRLQKKVLELERIVAQNAKIHAHRGTATTAGGGENGSSSAGGVGNRRMLPRLPCADTLQGHSAVVTCVQVHPVFTVVVSGSEDGTIKVSTSVL